MSNMARPLHIVLPLILISIFASIAKACESAESEFTLFRRDDICPIRYRYEQISPKVHETRPSPGKGLGVFATMNMSPGTPIIIEAPLLHVPMPEMVPGKGFMIANMISDIEAEFERLPADQQQEFLQLHDFRSPSDEGQSNLLTIFRSNAYNTGNSQVGVFPKIARINHSCRPNAGNHWSEKRNHRVIYATRDIEEGEEITVTYIPLLKTTKNRQARLQQYGFTCDCPACRCQDGDKKRVKIQDLLDSLSQKLPPPITERSKKMNERLFAKAMSLVQMVVEEGLVDYLAKAFHLAAIFSHRNGNLERAKHFARRELEIHQLAEKDSDDVKKTIGLIEDLEQDQT